MRILSISSSSVASTFKCQTDFLSAWIGSSRENMMKKRKKNMLSKII